MHLAASPETITRPTSQVNAATWAAAQTIGTWFLTEAARARVSVAELAAMLASSDVPPPVVERFAAAIGRAFARTRP